MNERIKELISQAQKEVWGNSPYNGSPEFEGYELDPKNFAELIINECVKICKDNGESYQHHMSLTSDLIKSHFGVKE